MAFPKLTYQINVTSMAFYKSVIYSITFFFFFPLPQPNTGDLDPIYVVEVLLNCSKESLKNSATEAAKPAMPDEKGEMQVCVS